MSVEISFGYFLCLNAPFDEDVYGPEKFIFFWCTTSLTILLVRKVETMFHICLPMSTEVLCYSLLSKIPPQNIVRLISHPKSDKFVGQNASHPFPSMHVLFILSL